MEDHSKISSVKELLDAGFKAQWNANTVLTKYKKDTLEYMYICYLNNTTGALDLRTPVKWLSHDKNKTQ